MTSASGCKTTEPVYVHTVSEVYVDRYVPVPERMTAPVEVIELPDGFDVYQLGAAYRASVIRIQQCNGQLAEIAGITPD